MTFSSRTGALIGILVILLIAFLAGRAHGQTPPYIVQHNSAQAFTANCLVHADGSPVYDFRDSCGVTPPPPSGRILTSRIAYVPSSGIRVVGVTEWSAVFGHASATDTELPFPGRPNSQPSLMDFRRTGYVALHFVPGSVGRFGMIQHTEYNYGADLTWAISTAAGDFNPANALCKGASVSGQTIGRWTTQGSTYRSFCPVLVGGNYYLNIKLTNPVQGTSTCPATSVNCVIGFANSWGG